MRQHVAGGTHIADAVRRPVDPRRPGLSWSVPVGPLGHVAEVTVSDDVGTQYVGAGQSTNSPAPTTSRFEIRFAPAPPATARELTLMVNGFLDPFMDGSEPIAGRWEFAVRLSPEPGASRGSTG